VIEQVSADRSIRTAMVRLRDLVSNQAAFAYLDAPDHRVAKDRRDPGALVVGDGLWPADEDSLNKGYGHAPILRTSDLVIAGAGHTLDRLDSLMIK
jgi:hypothetical protein